MFILYILLGMIIFIAMALYALTVKTDHILSSTPLKGYEYKKLYELIKKEFNTGNYKTWAHNDIINKCLSVNMTWNEQPANTKCDVSIWSLIGACLYISNSHCRKAPVTRSLYKYKRKYFLEYILLKIMVG